MQRDGLLDKSLTEGTAADDGTAVIVLDGTGKNLAGRGRPFVNQHHKGYLLVGAAAIAAILLTLGTATLGIDDELATREELVSHLDSRAQVAPSIAAQVNDEIGNALLT